MKLTLKPSAPDLTHAFPVISISNHHDCHTCDSVFETLVIPALIAAGFHPDSILDSMRTVEVPGAREPNGDPCGPEAGGERWLYAGVNTDLGPDYHRLDGIKFRVIGCEEDGRHDTLYMNGGVPNGDLEYAVLAGSEAHLALLDAGIMNLENEREVAV